MIHSIYSDHDSFKKIDFRDGFNVVLAERTEQSSQKESRNGLGKSTMINIIYFCLGGNPKGALNNIKLIDSTFTIELDLNGKKYKISRRPRDKNKIFIDGDYSDFPIEPKIDADGKRFLRYDSWRKVLGKFMFDLPLDLPTFNPTFASIVSYFIRRGNGFSDAFKQSSDQKTWDVQTNNAYLLDLGWTFATDLQILREKKYKIDVIKREIITGQSPIFVGDEGKLNAERIRLEIKAKQQKEELDNFRVNEQYEQIEKESNNITEIIHEDVNQNVVDNLLLNKYFSSFEEEQVTDIKLISDIYQEAGIHFSDKILGTLKEVNNFHTEIVKNRKEFLDSEIEKLKDKIKNRVNNIEELDKKRAKLMQILGTQGALKEYTEIQNNYNESYNELNNIKFRLEQLKNIKDEDANIKIEKQKLYQNALLDIRERDEQKNNAVSTFGKFSSSLYDEFGQLVIDLSETGFNFKIDIPKASSGGIENMKVFCYDLTLAKLWSKRKQSPGFLIHDSKIFDGVDERQRAGALQLAQSTSKDENFQYICTLNSDMIPQRDFKDNFNLHDYVVKTFTDNTPDGGILGMQI